MSAAEIVAANCVLVQPVTGRVDPFHRTRSPSQMNPLPLTRSVNAGLPAVADGGFSEEIVGSTVKVPTSLETCDKL